MVNLALFTSACGLSFNETLLNHFVSMDLSPSSHLQRSKDASLYESTKWKVSGGQFNTLRARTITQQNITNVQGSLAPQDSFERLLTEVAPAAFHNSAQRVDPPRCHANTRIAILDILMKWVVAEVSEKDMMWLHGAAGAGKSAIAQSLAELCIKNDVVVASFFFFRTDTTRNNVRPLVPTLVYQLIVIIPTIRTLILDIIEKDPLILEKSVEEQVLLLIIGPLQHLHQTRDFQLPILLLIDGLDECSGKDIQANIIHTFSNSMQTRSPIQFRVLISSRAEPHLVMTLNSRTVTPSLDRLPLDDQYMPDNDIRKFVEDHFALIHESHPLAYLLELDWPTATSVDQIVAKSSGQFIYASVVMKYVSSPRAHPSTSLEIIRGLMPPRSTAPFAQLDALYAHIFSEVEDLASVQPILAMALLATTNTSLITTYLGMAKGDVEALLSDLTSVIRVGDDLSFRHASLPDFLFDEARSQEYYLHGAAWAERLSKMLLSRAQEGKPPDLATLTHLLRRADPTPSLKRELLQFVPAQRYRRETQNASTLLSVISAMKFENSSNIYQTQLLRWVRFFKSSDHQIEDIAKGGHHRVKRALAIIAQDDKRTAALTAPLESNSSAYPENQRHANLAKDVAASDLPRRRTSSFIVVDMPEITDCHEEPEECSGQGTSGAPQRPKKGFVLSALTDAILPLRRRRKLQ